MRYANNPTEMTVLSMIMAMPSLDQSFSSDETSHPETAKNRIVSATNIRSISSSTNPIYSLPHKNGINSSPHYS